MSNTYNGLTTDLSASPYYDDYDETRGFYRILFKPALAVQARELTQLQTILQNQISRFGQNIFQEGSLVTGGEFNLDYQYHYVKIADIDNFSNPVNVADFLNTLVEGQDTGVAGIVQNAITGSESEDPDTKTLYVKYTSSGSDNTTKFFANGETLISNTGLSVNVLDPDTSIGVGMAFTINEGVIFAKGYFIRFDTQTLILSKYDTNPTCLVGFRIDESIITHQQDITLLDNARGSRNYTAPGADRLKLSPILVKYDDGETPSDDFVELLELKDGVVQKKYDRPQYALIRDEMARRTFDEAGDYVVRGLNIRLREHLDDGTNNGLYSANNGGNTNQLAIGVEKGLAYVHGYDVETLVTSYVTIDKGIDHQQADDQIVATNYGNYVRVNEVVGHWPVNTGATVSLYSTAQTRVSGLTYSTASQTGSLLGTAKLRTLKYESGTIGQASAVYRAYLYDIQMTSGAFSSVKSIYLDNATNGDAGADIVLESGLAVLKETDFITTVYPIAAQNIKTIRDASGNVDTTYTFMKSFDVSIATNGTFTVSTGVADEIFPFGAGALDSDQITSNIVVNLNGSATVAGTGTVTVNSSSNTVTGSGSAFLTQFSVGDKIKIGTSNEIRRIATIANNTSMTVSTNFTTSESGVAYFKQYLTGDIIDFTAKGATNVTRSVTIASSTAANFDMKETLGATVSATATVYLNKIDAREIRKVLHRNCYVLINCATNAGGTTGPWDLGIADILSLKDVRKATSFSAVTDGTSVLSSFQLDNGQRDFIYDHGKLILLSNGGLSLTSADKLLVKFDYFEHDYSIGNGYYSVDSYPIDDVNGAANTSAITTKEIPFFVSPTTGVKYDLRDSLDIRPTRISTANTTTSLTNITTDPASNSNITVPVSGLEYSAPNENFVASLSYYLPRKDLIVASKGGVFGSVRGIASSTPITPDYPADSMVIAVITVAPYPSLPADVAKSYGRTSLANQVKFVGNRRYTMKDIGTLDSRITNLEYYTSLSLLEKNTLDLKIVDGNGLDRFKNGIIVDPFSSHAIGDLDNPDYSCAIDPQAQELRPKFELMDIKNKLLSSTNVAITGSLITLPYTSTVFAQQPYASSTRNAAGLYYNFIGTMTLNPSDDTWTNTTQAPNLVINNDNASEIAAWNTLANSWGTQWNDWQTVWTGTSTSTTNNANGSKTTTTTTTQDQSRTGTSYVVKTTTTTQDYGQRVVDASLIPYMRSRAIQVTCTGLKPNTRMFAFFDTENVNAYVQQTNSSFVATKSIGDPIISDGDGKVYAIFYLPSTNTVKFTVGTKVFRLTDSITNSDVLGDVTTSAEASYSSYGLSEVKQDTIVSTVQPVLSQKSVTQTRVNVSTSTTTTSPPPPPAPPPPAPTSTPPYNGVSDYFSVSHGSKPFDPIGQSFIIDLDPTIPGIFVTKLDLYFAAKDAKYGVTVELREMDASGLITNSVVPFSQVYIPNSAINVNSTNGTTKTTITFPGLVYLLNKTEYAFVVKPEATNPNTVLWTSVLGQNDIATGNRISSQPYAGVLFASSNDATWNPIQDEDIKFTLYAAIFDMSVVGNVTFGNGDYNFITANTTNGTWDVPQETVYGEWKLTIGSIAGGTPNNNLLIKGGTSLTVGTIGPTSNTTVFSMQNVWANTGYVNENVSFLFANGSPTGITGTITNVSVSSHVIESWDPDELNAHFLTNSGSFAVGEQLIGRTSNSSMIVQSIDNLPVNLYNFAASQVTVSGTNVVWSAKTTSNTNVLDANFSTIMINNNNETSSEHSILSKINEGSVLSGSKSVQLAGALYSAIPYVSPVINKDRNHTIFVHNLINNDDTGEDNANGGNAIDRYITQKVTLADGQDAEDLRIYLTSYKPPASNIEVYCKILHGEDSDTFSSRDWWRMTLTSTDAVSSTENKQDFKEFTYEIDSSHLTGSNGEVQYVNSNGVTFTGFKYFAIKIVLLSSNSSEIPRCKDLRGIALQI